MPAQTPLWQSAASLQPLPSGHCGQRANEELISLVEFVDLIARFRRVVPRLTDKQAIYFGAHVEQDEGHSDALLEPLYRLINGDRRELIRAFGLQDEHLGWNHAWYDSLMIVHTLETGQVGALRAA